MKGILCFGDSITFGRGEQPARSWCGRLKERFEAEDPFNGVYTLGIPGETSTELLQRFDVEATARIRLKRPGDTYLILIATGINDAKLDKTPSGERPRTEESVFEQNIKELIKKAKNYKATIAFIGLTPIDERRTHPFEETSFTKKRVDAFNEILKRCCEEEAVPFLDIRSEQSGSDWTPLLSDGLHPNEQGYDRLFTMIEAFIEREGLIRQKN